MQHLVDRVIEWEGDTWLVGNVGVVNEANEVFCHLWSRTKIICVQRNGGKVPKQACAFVPLSAFN
jgi:hypothetical protein